MAYTDGAVAAFFGFDIEKSHETLVLRLNEIVSLNGSSIKLQVEFTFAMMSVMAAFISFITMKCSVNFAFYTFVMLRTASRQSAANYLQN